MIPDEKTSSVGQQEFIDLLCRLSKSNEEVAATTNEPDVTIIDDTPATEEGEIITLDDDDDDGVNHSKEVEDGEITESQGSDNDDIEELNLRLSALRSLPGAKEQRRQKAKKLKSRRKRVSDTSRYITDDIDLRPPMRNRSYRRISQTSNYDDREYLLDKDYRQPNVFDMLLSLISPDNNNKKLNDNYDIQHMDIVEDQPIASAFPPPLPPNHLTFFDPLPPLPPPPPPLFEMFPPSQPFAAHNWPRPNFVQQPSMPPLHTELWAPPFHNPTDIDLRLQPANNHQHILPPGRERIVHRKASQPRRKRAKKLPKKHPPRHQVLTESRVMIPITTHDPELERKATPPPSESQPNDNDDNDDEERLLREQLLRTLSSKRKVRIVEQPTPPSERIVTIERVTLPTPLPLPVSQSTAVLVSKPVEVATKSQYTINQRYKRVKANVSSTTIASKTEATTVVRTVTQPVFQTRNKIVRAPELDLLELPHSTPIIITFDDESTDDDEQQQAIVKSTTESTYLIPDEERQAIKRLQQLQEEVIRRSNASEPPTKPVVSKAQTPQSVVEAVQEAIPSTDELSALFEKRRMLLTERSKYNEIHEKMKKKKLENGLLAREMERLDEQLLSKKAQVTKNNMFLQYWQKEALAIAQNIKEQEGLIMQSTVFKSVKPNAPPVIRTRSTTEFDYASIPKAFQENSTQLLLSILICPLSLYQKLRPYHVWLNAVSKKPQQLSLNGSSCSLLRTRSFATQDHAHYWKTSLQAYLIDINQIFCPYELQGSCKAQHCIYQHQHQISSRIDQFLSSKNFDEKNKQTLLNQISSVCSLPTFDIDLLVLEKKISEKRYHRCRTKLDRYLAIYHEDFRYFRDHNNSDAQSAVHPILFSVSNQLDSDGFSLERAVADLVEGLESQRTNAQLWCLYLEFSSWHMSSTDLQHLCFAALKNAQSYDLFWTVFCLCATNVDELVPLYLTYIQSDQFDFHNRSYAICELAMFDASLAANDDQAYQRIKNYLPNSALETEHRVYLVLVLLYTYAFGAFPRILYQQMDDARFEKQLYLEPFICPWNALSTYAHSHNEIDQCFDDFMNPMELSESHLGLCVNKIHYLQATTRFTQSKLYIETLLDAFPCSIELWIELLLHPELSQAIPETLERARKTTGIYFEFVYSLSSAIDIRQLLTNEPIPTKTFREKFFSDLCQSLLESNVALREKKTEENLLRHNGELRDIAILDVLLHPPEFAIDVQQRLILKIVNHLLAHGDQQRMLMLYSFFRRMDVRRVLDMVIDCFLSINLDRYEWVLKPFTYRLLDVATNKERDALLWIRFDAFTKQWINHTQSQEIYVTLLQRLITSTEDKHKIARLCRLFEKQFPNGGLISPHLRQTIYNSTPAPAATDTDTAYSRGQETNK